MEKIYIMMASLKGIIGHFTYKRCLIVALLLVQTVFCMAKHVNKDDALTIAHQFYQARLAKQGTSSIRKTKAKSLTRSDFHLNYTRTDLIPKKVSSASVSSSDSVTSYYVYNIGDNQGFVIAAGEDAVKSVLGYSLEGSFSNSSIPSNVKVWLNHYASEIKYAAASGISAALLDSISGLKSSGSTTQTGDVVAPLLGNIKWDQSSPYNLLCPKSGSTYTETGCVATAMAQIMKYYQWPVTGTGTVSYRDSPYGTLSVNFSKSTYDWTDMLDGYGFSGSGLTTTGKQDTAVATLMYNCGVAAKMQYNTDANGGSSANVYDAATALVTNFGYDKNIQVYDRSIYTESQWESLIKAELNAARPVLYAGNESDSVGHAFVCDGYDSDDLYHINWGWSGLYDGYFQLSALNPDFSGSVNTTGGFSEYQDIITGIQKPSSTSHSSFELGLYNEGLTASVSSLSSISTQTFSLSYGFVNYGINTFAGKIGVGLYKNNVLQEVLSSNTITDLQSGYGDASDTLSDISLSGLSAGTYQIYCIYQPQDSTSWSIFHSSTGLNNYLNVVISGTTATFQTPATLPVLALTKAVQLSGKAYQYTTANFNVTVQNTGTEFYSNLGIYIYSASGTTHQYVNHGVVCVPTDSTRTFTLSGEIICAPGSYYAVAVYDSTNTYSTTHYKNLTPVVDNSIPFTILSTPTAATLKMVRALALSADSTVIVNNQDLTLTAKVNNSGGYYNDQIIAFIFPGKGGSSLGYLNPITVTIDTGDTVSVALTGAVDLDPGSYFFGLDYYRNGSWVSLSPSDSAQLAFTVVKATTTVNTDTTIVNNNGLTIYPNPVSNTLNITGLTEESATITLYDITGKMVLSQPLSGSTINLESLTNGIYILKIVTADGVTKKKIIKQ